MKKILTFVNTQILFMVGKALIKLLHENSNAVHSNEKVLNSVDSVYMHFLSLTVEENSQTIVLFNMLSILCR